MFISGISLHEVPSARKRYQKCLNWEAYNEYLQRTSILFPFPPAVYARVPRWLKRTMFLEFSIYVFKPSSGDEEVRRKSLNEGNQESREASS